MQCGRLDGSYWAAMAEPRYWRIVVRPGLPGLGVSLRVQCRHGGDGRTVAAGGLFLGLSGHVVVPQLVWREEGEEEAVVSAGGRGGLRFVLRC